VIAGADRSTAYGEPMTSVDSEIRAHLEDQLEAIETKDLERLMGRYSDDVVYFDVVPPLRFVGSAALRERFTTWFDASTAPSGWTSGT
jgi:ketosteroid isomerase-like protein